MTERKLRSAVMVTASRLGARLFRNNVGLGWVGKATRFASTQGVLVKPGDVIIRNARPLHAGLCNGSSDLIGWKPIRITAAMVGETVAVFTALELKTEGVELSDGQLSFLLAVRTAGGIADEIRDVADVPRALQK